MRKIIIIESSNNFNELGLVRNFGVNKIKPYGIIICKKNKRKVKKCILKKLLITTM